MLLILAVVATSCDTTSDSTTTAVAPQPTASPARSPLEGELIVVQGVATVNGTDVSPDEFKKIKLGDEIIVKEGARARLTSEEFAFELFMGAIFHLEALNGLELSAVLDGGHLRFWFKDDTDARLLLKTPSAEMTTIGSDTEFTVCQPSEAKTCLVVEEGEVELIYQGERETYHGDGSVNQGAFVSVGEDLKPTVCLPSHEFEAWLEQARLDETSPPLGQLVNGSLPCGSVSRTWTSIPAVEVWTDTEVDVAAGDTLRIEAGGAIAHGGGGPLIFPDGDSTRNPHVSNLPEVRNTNHASLIGKIGEDGTAFLVGSNYEGVAETGGRLFLGINDVGVDNNDGEFFAVITVVSS